MTRDATARQRARLAELETALARLRARYDLLMNGFKFDEARALVAPIEAAEREFAALAETVPPLLPYAVTRRRRRQS